LELAVHYLSSERERDEIDEGKGGKQNASKLIKLKLSY